MKFKDIKRQVKEWKKLVDPTLVVVPRNPFDEPMAKLLTEFMKDHAKPIAEVCDLDIDEDNPLF